MNKGILKARVVFSLDAAQEMYDELHDKFMEFNAFEEEFPPECKYIQNVKYIIEQLELALGEINE